MHTIAISETAPNACAPAVGKLHPFDTLEPRRTALLVIDMQNYFVKPGHQGEVPMAREIVPNINRLGAELRRRGGHVVWIRNGTAGTRQSWSNYHDGLMTPERMRRRYEAMEVGQDGYEFWHELDIRPEDGKVDKKRYSAFIQGSSDIERHLREREHRHRADRRHRHQRLLRKHGARRDDAQLQVDHGWRTASPPTRTRSTTRRCRRSMASSATCRRSTRFCNRSTAERRARRRLAEPLLRRLVAHENAGNRPDLVARVLRQAGADRSAGVE